MPNSLYPLPLVIANWKSHKTWEQAQAWLQEWDAHQIMTAATVALAPAFPFLELVADEVEGHDWSLELAVQDLSSYPAGAYTGAISTANLDGLPVRFAILGHSERRRYFHETNQDVANKVEQALEADITPIICVDQPYQAQQAAAIPSSAYGKCVVAYEPLEAIGSGVPQSAEEVEKVVSEIHQSWGDVPVIYGGSVSAENVNSYLKSCQGVLVATHSLDAKDFAQVVKNASLGV